MRENYLYSETGQNTGISNIFIWKSFMLTKAAFV